MADATPINWSNLTPEQADFLRTIAPMAGTTLHAYIDGCDRRMLASAPDSGWHKDAAAEKARWQRLHTKLRTLQNQALRVTLRRAA